MGEIPNSTAASRAAKAASDSARKSSANAQDAGRGADLGEVWPATRFTRVSVAKPPAAHPYDGAMTHTVVAELVAAVLKVEVEVGQQVAAADSVVILESMKMEIPVLAEVAGSVVEVVVTDGDVVNDGDPLVVIQPRS
jgi:acetyl-CoA carboxylase biotin carboxyl carrier protein